MRITDIAELAAIDSARERDVASNYMPSVMQMTVLNADLHSSAGWVWCDLEGRRVRCIVPHGFDLSEANTSVGKFVLWALPINGRARGPEYIALGMAWNGADDSRKPRQNNVYISPVTSMAVTTTVNALYEVIEVNTVAGSVTLNLPALATVRGKHLYIKKISGDGNSMTIDGNSTETIDGSTTKSKTSQWSYWHIVAGVSNWLIVGEG